MTTITEKTAKEICDMFACNYNEDSKPLYDATANKAINCVLDELIAEAEKEQKIAENDPLDTYDYELYWLKHWLKSYKDKL